MPESLRNFLITLRTFDSALADELQDWLDTAPERRVVRDMLAILKELALPYTTRHGH